MERTVALPVGVDGAWEMLSDDRKLGIWLGGEFTADLRPGGHLALIGREGAHMVGNVIDVRPRRRLAFVWWEQRPFGLPRRSVVELSLRTRGGTTLLRVRERPVPAPAVTVRLPRFHDARLESFGTRSPMVGVAT